MDFSQALKLLKQGLILTRPCTAIFWKIDNNRITAYTYIGGKEVLARTLNSVDILAEDWESFREIDFKAIIEEGIKSFPKDWREGQKVFNYIDYHYGDIARRTQDKGIDCFHGNNTIDIFIHECYNLLTNS